MRHVHYDLDQVEAQLRAMYANAPNDQIHGNPAVASAFRRSIDVEVAFMRWQFSEIMQAVPASVTLDALVVIFANSIVNRLSAYVPDEDGPPAIVQFIPELLDAVSRAWSIRESQGLSDTAIEVSPVTCGTA
jgi:hypothetical protein